MQNSKTNALSVFSYQGNEITFQNENGVMVNATQMAKSFNKRTVIWLSNQQTKDFIEELSKVRNLTLADLVQVKKGGNNSGTWMHEDVALEFARWLSPSFAIWCNDRIKELITQGVSTLSDDDETIANAMLILQRRLDASSRQLQNEKRRNALLQAQAEASAVAIDARDHQISLARPSVLFRRAVEASVNDVLVGDLAKLIAQNGISVGQNRLFEWMRDNGYLIKREGSSYNLPKQTYINHGLFRVEQHTLTNRHTGAKFVSFTPRVTGKGQVYFINKFMYAYENGIDLINQKGGAQ